MTKRMRWWAAAVLLPGLLLRAFIPVGFMPMVGPGYRVQLVVCDSYAPVPWATDSMQMDMSMPMDPGMDMSQHHHADGAGGGPPVHQDHGSCPYGSSPALGGTPTLAVLPAVLPQAPELIVATPQVAYFAVSPRAQSPRGPPAKA
jgi:hypothetical protein